MFLLDKKLISLVKKITPPHYLILFLIYILMLFLFSSLILALGLRDSVLYLLVIPGTFSAFFYDRWVSHLMLTMLTGAAIWLTSIVSCNFEASLYSIGIAGVIGIAITQSIYALKASKEALRVSEEKYRLLTEAMQDVIVQISSTGKVLFISSPIKSFGGYNAENEKGESASKYFAQEKDISKANELFAKILATRQGGIFGFLFKAKDREPFPVETTYLPIMESNKVIAIQIVLRDISERKKAQQALEHERDLANALEKAAAIIPSTLNLDEVLNLILEEVMRIIPCDAANIMLINNQQVSIVRWRGYQHFGAEEFVSTFLYTLSDMQNLQRMYEKKESLIINDTASYPDWVDVPIQKWLRSCAATPIIIQDTVIGFLNVDSATPNFFSKTHFKYLQTFASYAASAINNARLYEKSQKEIEARKKAEKKLRQQATTDYLTGIFNRRYFFETARKELERAQRYNHPLSIIIFDIDHFKKINDTYGHGAGDKALCLLTVEGKSRLRENDVFARYGGEEFVILLPETDLEQARQMAERMRKKRAETPLNLGVATVKLTISFGVSSLDNENIPLDELLLRTDKALYQAKETGRNRVCVWEKS